MSKAKEVPLYRKRLVSMLLNPSVPRGLKDDLKEALDESDVLKHIVSEAETHFVNWRAALVEIGEKATNSSDKAYALHELRALTHIEELVKAWRLIGNPQILLETEYREKTKQPVLPQSPDVGTGS